MSLPAVRGTADVTDRRGHRPYKQPDLQFHSHGSAGPYLNWRTPGSPEAHVIHRGRGSLTAVATAGDRPPRFMTGLPSTMPRTSAMFLVLATDIRLSCEHSLLLIDRDSL
jgi:hypothetical protein